MGYARKKRNPRYNLKFRPADDTYLFILHTAEEFDIRVGTVVPLATEFLCYRGMNTFEEQISQHKIRLRSDRRSKSNLVNALIYGDTYKDIRAIAEKHGYSMYTLMFAFADFVFLEQRNEFKQFLMDNWLQVRMDACL